MSDNSDMLKGIDEIIEFWDPHMTRDFFYRNIRPHLEAILFERAYLNRRKVSKDREKVDRYYTYKSLVLQLKLKLKQKEIF